MNRDQQQREVCEGVGMHLQLLVQLVSPGRLPVGGCNSGVLLLLLQAQSLASSQHNKSAQEAGPVPKVRQP